MNHTVTHEYFATRGLHLYRVIKDNNNVVTQILFSSKGNFQIRHPGQLRITVLAQYHMRKFDGRPQTIRVRFPVSVKIFSPDGREFTAGHVTLSDLNRFRDLRGVSQGAWRYVAEGDSGLIEPPEDPDIPIDLQRRWVFGPDAGYLRIAVDETFSSQSAGPLVDDRVGPGTKVYSFDLYREGEFVANVISFDINLPWRGRMRLRNPNGTVVASGGIHGLSFPVTLRTLDQSRDAAGQIRQWSLEIETIINEGRIFATVKTTVKVPVALIQDRINYLIGANGNKIRIYGEHKNFRALGRIMILDPYTAEAMDMRKMLKPFIEDEEQDPGVDPSRVEPNVAYTFESKDQSIGHGFSADISDFKVDMLQITIGASQHIRPVVPAIKVRLEVQGGIEFDFGDNVYAYEAHVATASLKNNSITLEVGAKLNFGDIETVSWISDDPIDIDFSLSAWATIGALTGFVTLGAAKEFLEQWVNDLFIEKFRTKVQDSVLSVKRFMIALLGGNFTLTSLRMNDEKDAIIIDYLSPVEPEPKPNSSYEGVIGRDVQMPSDLTGWLFFPPTLGDTWAADNLRNKIHHIVVVMMENRSFDHVLGYRALLPDAQNENGLTNELLVFLANRGFEIERLRESEITVSKTRFPLSVGHSLTDVAEQLSKTLTTNSGLMINSPQGFVDNFKSKMPEPILGEFGPVNLFGVVEKDVLGYYTDEDLNFYDFLAKNYAYCQLYFSSHPGPTFPNRMYLLTGDVQYDRTGEPILSNNKDDNLLLSRALNIFDVLERKGVSWRVYESFPSVAMLRFFARYAADNTHIVDISRLKEDIAVGNLPSVTFIEPAMHHSPKNDDLPPFADMLQGQHFLKGVYDTLRQSDAWRNTLLIITYDEHGGFYDHVIPPVADALSPRSFLSHGDMSSLTPSFKKNMTIPYGVRVPTFVVSPWVPPGKSPDIVLDHCSILKTILACFCGNDRPFLSGRVHASHSFESFLTQSEPRLDEIPDPPILPRFFSQRRRIGKTQAIDTKPLTEKALDEGDVDFHDITGMLARMLGRR
jgi:phospholipase C